MFNVNNGKIIWRCTIFLILLAAIHSIPAYAQEPDTLFLRYNHSEDYDTLIYKTDTVVYSSSMQRNFLIGTTVLPNTPRALTARAHGFYLASVTKASCPNGGLGFNADRINSVMETDSTLTVDITIGANCCYDFLCDVSVDKQGTLNLHFQGYGVNCACLCCFGLTFYFEKEKEFYYEKSKAVMIAGNPKTRRLLKK